jgi:predicted metallopeptidase
MIRYEIAKDIEEKVLRILETANFNHIDRKRLVCIRSRGSSARNIIARCHALSKIWQKALCCDAVYIIEVISEKFDKLDEEEKVKTLLHELMHIPKSFGGGFKHHDWVNNKNIERIYREFLKKNNGNKNFWDESTGM